MAKNGKILVTGQSKLSFSVVVCLLQAGNRVSLFTDDIANAKKQIDIHIEAIKKSNAKDFDINFLNIIESLNKKSDYELAIAITDENLEEKKSLIKQIEEYLDESSLIAINTESFSLDNIQEEATNSARIIGLNWVEPAHTTYFLEIITNEKNNALQVDDLCNTARISWNKDPYVIKNAISVRSRLFGAMAREAFYLIENGYASVNDIDRACRNDAGYYLPFAGNFRYMDLMGTLSYSEVMKKLNAELSNETGVPKTLNDIVTDGGLGMENNKGFYSYNNGDTKDWEKLFTNFSYKIKDIIEKYPFNYNKTVKDNSL